MDGEQISHYSTNITSYLLTYDVSKFHKKINCSTISEIKLCTRFSQLDKTRNYNYMAFPPKGSIRAEFMSNIFLRCNVN